MKRLLFFTFLFAALLPAALIAQTLTSPDGRYRFSYCQVGGAMGYCITFDGDTIVRPSRLGVDIENQFFESALAVPRGNNVDWSADLVLCGEELTERDTTWSPLYGENARIRDHYRQLVLHFEKGSNGQGKVSEGYDKRKFYALDVIVRAYDEGVALRYHFPETSNGLFLHVTGERTAFRMPAGTMAWYEEWAQGPYDLRPLRQPWEESERPLLMRLTNGTYVALLEAGLLNFPRGKFALAADDELQVRLYGDVDLISPFDTPWRVVMAARKAVDLINHKELVLNLCDEPVTPPPSWAWIRPGRAFRCTRLDRASLLRSIDFCREFGIEYVELDAGWYGPEGKVESDARQAAPTRDFLMEEICAYARQKGIGVWVYVNQRALARQLDDLLPIYEQWGVSGIKFGFVQVGSAQWTSWLHEAVRKCADHHLQVDIHDEYRPTGISRTLPNLLTQEGIRGNEEMPDATHNVILPFTRYLCGPADYTLCYFNNRVRCTHAHQLAMAAVYYSPLQFLFWYDLPYPDGWDGAELQFWRDCPTVFDESCALDGEPSEYIVQARRKGDEWFVGAMTNTEARSINVPTNFLQRGHKYTVTLYTDNPTLGTRSKVDVRQMQMKAGKSIPLQLMASGGAALHFKPTNKK